MDAATLTSIGKIGGSLVFGLSAIGSGLGTGIAAMAGIGAWKKCYAQSKAAPFMIVAFIGAPLSQTIYGMIVMRWIATAAEGIKAAAAGTAAAAELTYTVSPAQPWSLLAAGLLGGLAIGMSAYMQGRACASASDALGETGQGFGNSLMAIGIIETVALFALVFISRVIG